MSDRRQACKIREAIPEHVFGIHRTMLRALAAAGTDYPAPDMPYCVQACLDLIAQGFVGVAVIEEWGGDRIVGVIMLDYARWPWTAPQNPKGFHLYNQHFWVEPDYRGFGTAKKLLGFAKAVGDRKQLPLVLSFSNMTEDPDVRDRFARINGFGYTGGVFVRSPGI